MIFFENGLDFCPGLRRRLGIEPGFFEHVLVVVHDRRRGIERHRQHVAVGVRVVADDGRQEAFGIEGLALVGHQLVDRIDGALGRHHGAGADFEHLHDGRLLVGAERGDRAGHRLRIGALEDRHDLVVGLRFIELVGDLLELRAELATHRVPPCDFGNGECGGGRKKCEASRETGRNYLMFHSFLPFFVGEIVSSADGSIGGM